MVEIISSIWIGRSIEIVFDAARSVEMHLQAERRSQETAVGDKTSGLLELGDIITFEAVHFGIRQRLTSKIVEFDQPTKFADKMQSGAFRSLTHIHEFAPEINGTRMTDTLVFEEPLGILGLIVESVVLRAYMTRFIRNHQVELKNLLEGS